MSRSFLRTAKDQVDAEFLWYQREVRKLSEKNLKKNYLENKELRGNGHSLDHKISIKECFDSGLAPDVASDIANLEIIPIAHNSEKGRKSSLTIHELFKIISERED